MKHRLLVLILLLAFIGSLSVPLLQAQVVSAASSKSCTGVGCYSLVVKLVDGAGNPVSGATVTATRQANVQKDNSFTLDPTPTPGAYTSGGPVWGTNASSASSPWCQTNKTPGVVPPEALFNITVSGPGIISSPPTTTDLCGSSGGTKTVTITVSTSSAPAQLGSLQGKAVATAGTPCTGGALELKGLNGINFDQPIQINGQGIYSTQNTDLNGKVIQLQPGQYSITNIHCIANGQQYPIADISPITIKVGNNTQDLNSSVAPSTQTTDPNANPDISCENKLGLGDIAHPAAAIGKGINWLVCTVIRGVNNAINEFDGYIQQELQFNSSRLENPGLYAAWSAFRYIAVGLLVLIGLAMVISQMIGIGIFDAYTVKKLLPRIFVAAILITLSWTLCKIVVDIFNVIGGAVRSLIYAPFGGADVIGKAVTQRIQSQSSTGTNTIGFAGAAIGGYFLIATTNFLVILSFALPALIAILLAFFFIIMRQVVIILMVLLSPLAVVAYILPGTDKVWKFWRENFLRALIMYPLIIAFLSIGRVFAYIVAQEKTGSGLNEIVALVAYFGPYFAVPATFKLAGGVLSSAHGVLNDRSKGLIDRNKKFRQQNQAKTWSRTKAGSRFQERNALARGFNRFSQGAATGMKGHYGVGSRGRAAVDLSSRLAQAEAQKNPLLQQLAFNDDGIMALALSGGSTDRARTALKKVRPDWNDDKINKAVAAAQAVGVNRENSLAALDLMAKNKSFSLPAGPTGMQAILDTADAIAGVTRNAKGEVVSGNGTLAENIMGGFEYSSRGAGRLDLGHHDYAGWKPDMSAAWSKASLPQHAQAAGDSTKVFGDHFNSLMKSTDANDRAKAAVSLLEMQNALPSATAGNQVHINKALEQAGVDFNRRVNVTDATGNTLVDPVTGNPQTRAESVEEQLVRLSNGAISVPELRAKARVYDSGVPFDQRMGSPPGGPAAGATPGSS